MQPHSAYASLLSKALQGQSLRLISQLPLWGPNPHSPMSARPLLAALPTSAPSLRTLSRHPSLLRCLHMPALCTSSLPALHA